jgi:tRNA threonylcarbamoyl adenosine modification protein (Sua5/YciO/YrdC/YwlC family)
MQNNHLFYRGANFFALLLFISLMLLHINPQNPPERLIQQAVDILTQGGIIIYPTDTVYALGCDITQKKAIDRITQLKGLNAEKVNFSCICADLSSITDYAVGITTPIYKLMRAALPGPYTFILKASKNIPKFFQSNKKTVGIRIVDNLIATEMVRMLGRPIVTTSLKQEDTLLEYITEPELIYEKYKKIVDLVIDGGPGGVIPSTVLDVSEGENAIKIIREGLGSLSALNIEMEAF